MSKVGSLFACQQTGRSWEHRESTSSQRASQQVLAVVEVAVERAQLVISLESMVPGNRSWQA